MFKLNEDDKRILSKAIDDTVDCAVKSLGIGNNVMDEVKKKERESDIVTDESISKMRRGRR